jgi:hypothetical protein
MSNYFRHFRVFAREQRLVKIYQCFEDITSGLFAVQSCDYVNTLDEPEFKFQETQLLELFSEELPLTRCDWFHSLIEAIAAHEKEF